MDNYHVSKVFIFDKEVTSFQVDPFLETGDTNLSNNSWPKKVDPSKFNLFRENRPQENPMQRQRRLEEGE